MELLWQNMEEAVQSMQRIHMEKKVKVEWQRAIWECGVSNYWGNVLFQRCLKSERFREKLDEAILDLKEYLSEERLGTMIEK